MDQTAEKVINWRYDRVRANSHPELNQRIDERTAHSLRLYANADRALIGRRLEELDREWDMERCLETGAASLTVAGLVFGKIWSRVFNLLPVAVGGFLLQHAIQGWCPPLVIFRSRGIRTRKEIERERYALKLLRGDFDSFHSGEKPDVERILHMLDL